MRTSSLKTHLPSGLAALALIVTGALAPMPILTGEARAQGLFNRIAGEGCRDLQQAGGQFWQGFYRGREESPFLTDDGLYEVTHYRCFQSEAACNGWLYDMQSTYVTTSRTWCRPQVG